MVEGDELQIKLGKHPAPSSPAPFAELLRELLGARNRAISALVVEPLPRSSPTPSATATKARRLRTYSSRLVAIGLRPRWTLSVLVATALAVRALMSTEHPEVT